MFVLLFQVFCCVVTSQMKKKRCTSLQLRILVRYYYWRKKQQVGKDNSNENALNLLGRVCTALELVIKSDAENLINVSKGYWVLFI